MDLRFSSRDIPNCADDNQLLEEMRNFVERNPGQYAIFRDTRTTIYLLLDQNDFVLPFHLWRNPTAFLSTTDDAAMAQHDTELRPHSRVVQLLTIYRIAPGLTDDLMDLGSAFRLMFDPANHKTTVHAITDDLIDMGSPIRLLFEGSAITSSPAGLADDLIDYGSSMRLLFEPPTTNHTNPGLRDYHIDSGIAVRLLSKVHPVTETAPGLVNYFAGYLSSLLQLLFGPTARPNINHDSPVYRIGDNVDRRQGIAHYLRRLSRAYVRLCYDDQGFTPEGFALHYLVVCIGFAIVFKRISYWWTGV